MSRSSILRSSLAVVFCAALALACASDPPAFPDATVSEHFRTTGAAFQFDTRSRAARYVVAYAVVEPFGQPVKLRVAFQNPVNPNRPFVVERDLAPGEAQLTVVSPALPPLKNGAIYQTVLTAHHADSGVELARHEQPILFVRASGL